MVDEMAVHLAVLTAGGSAVPRVVAMAERRAAQLDIGLVVTLVAMKAAQMEHLSAAVMVAE